MEPLCLFLGSRFNWMIPKLNPFSIRQYQAGHSCVSGGLSYVKKKTCPFWSLYVCFLGGSKTQPTCWACKHQVCTSSFFTLIFFNFRFKSSRTRFNWMIPKLSLFLSDNTRQVIAVFQGALAMSRKKRAHFGAFMFVSWVDQKRVSTGWFLNWVLFLWAVSIGWFLNWVLFLSDNTRQVIAVFYLSYVKKKTCPFWSLYVCFLGGSKTRFNWMIPKLNPFSIRQYQAGHSCVSGGLSYVKKKTCPFWSLYVCFLGGSKNTTDLLSL